MGWRLKPGVRDFNQQRHGDPSENDDDPTGWKTARELIGCIKEKPLAPNISEDHDRYIYRK